jgi:hypothetical protein
MFTEQQLAAMYNSASPAEQKELDRQLEAVKRMGISTPRGLTTLFPGLKAKNLKIKETPA